MAPKEAKLLNCNFAFKIIKNTAQLYNKNFKTLQ